MGCLNSSRRPFVVLACIIIFLSLILSSSLATFAISEVTPSAAPSVWTGTLSTYYGTPLTSRLHWGMFIDEIYSLYESSFDFSLLEYSYYYVVPIKSAGDYLDVYVFLSKDPIFSSVLIQNSSSFSSSDLSYGEAIEWSADNFSYDSSGNLIGINGVMVGNGDSTESSGSTDVTYENMFVFKPTAVFGFMFSLPQYYSASATPAARLDYVAYSSANSMGYSDDPSSGYFSDSPLTDLMNILLRNSYRAYGQGATPFPGITADHTVPVPWTNLNSAARPYDPPVSAARVFSTYYNSTQDVYFSGIVTNESGFSSVEPDNANVDEATFSEFLAEYSPFALYSIGKDSLAWASYYYRFFNPSEHSGSQLNQAINIIADSLQDTQTEGRDLLNSIIDDVDKDAVSILTPSDALGSFGYVASSAASIFTTVYNAFMANGVWAMLIFIALALLILRALLQRG